MRRTGGPSVSLGIPVYNGETCVEEAVESVLGQTFRDVELVISDDASTDGTERICRRMAERDRRIRYVRQERNIGMYHNFIAVARLSRGRFFKWLGHDDVLDKDCVRRLHDLLHECPTATVATCRTPRYVSREGEGVDTKSWTGAPAAEATFRLSRLERLEYVLGPRRPTWVLYGLFVAEPLRKAMPLFERGVHSMRWEVLVQCWALDRGDVAVCPDPLFSYRLGGTHVRMKGGLRLGQLLRSFQAEARFLPRVVDFASLPPQDRARVSTMMLRHLYVALRRSYWPHARARLKALFPENGTVRVNGEEEVRL